MYVLYAFVIPRHVRDFMDKCILVIKSFWWNSKVHSFRIIQYHSQRACEESWPSSRDDVGLKCKPIKRQNATEMCMDAVNQSGTMDMLEYFWESHPDKAYLRFLQNYKKLLTLSTSMTGRPKPSSAGMTDCANISIYYLSSITRIAIFYFYYYC